MWDGRPAAREEPGHVGVHDTPPVVVPLRFDTAEPPDAGVVDENIEPAMAPHRLVDERFHGEVIADVGGDGHDTGAGRREPFQIRLRFLQVIFIDAADCDVRAFL